MPDGQGKLSDEEKKDLADRLHQRGVGQSPCAACGQTKFILADHIVAPPLFAGGMILGGPNYPQAMVVCRNCGNTRYFNTVILGILSKSEEENE